MKSFSWYEVEETADMKNYWYGKKKGCQFAKESCRAYIDHVQDNRLYTQEFVLENNILQ